MNLSAIPFSHNLLAWMIQTTVLATLAAILPVAFRLRHPRAQLLYCHAALAACLLLPVLQPWRVLSGKPSPLFAVTRYEWWLFGILIAGFVLQLVSLSAGLFRTRRFRIAASPLYPVPEPMRAAAAITQADALFCISEETRGPVMLGWLAPVVLLPTSILQLGEEAQCGIACHELLHVRRGDWLVTLIEGIANALLWFNPGAWLLLSEARLAREQIVDAESVRLTAAPEPYIDALLAIARERAGMDLAGAPSFLWRSHLTQRMQLLLSDAPVSSIRVAGSLCSMIAVLGGAMWFIAAAFPLLSAQYVPVAPSIAAASVPAPQPAPVTPKVAAVRPASPPQAALPVSDPYEPVNGGISEVSAADRAEALALPGRARAAALRHERGVPPYRLHASFAAGGNALQTGQGEISETWMTGQRWQWTVNLGSISHVQQVYLGVLFENQHIAVIPMRAHMLRNEIFWARAQPGLAARLRTAKTLWQGKPATCLLESPDSAIDGFDSSAQARFWNEDEYCFDDASGDLVVHSFVPGTYAQFEYGAQTQFHQLRIPERIRIYVAGTAVVDASLQITDATAADESALTPAPEMTSSPTPTQLGPAFRAWAPAKNGGQAIVHAEVDGDGNVVEAEVSSIRDADGAAMAQQVREMNFRPYGHGAAGLYLPPLNQKRGFHDETVLCPAGGSARRHSHG